MTEQQLEELLDRIQGDVSDEDYQTLASIAGSLVYVQRLLGTDRMSLRKLREILLGKKSERTRKVVKDHDGNDEESAVDGDAQSAAAGTESTDDDSAPSDVNKPKAKGHGRNGAREYSGGKRVPVAHQELGSGEACPLCPKGKVYSKREPSRLVRFVGQAPLHATVYELERLRCNLCGEMFTAAPPEGVGADKYDASAAAMLGLLKYGTGMPFFRLERLQASLSIPLPKSTQWDILKDASPSLTPACEELIRQAAQGEVVYNDDTFMRVLTLMKENESLNPDKDRTGMFTTGVVSTAGGRRIALFFTGRKHAGENLQRVLNERAEHLGPPIQMCDALDRNYPKELEVIISNCIAHGRRKFVDIFSVFPEECRHVLEQLKLVYKNDDVARERGLSPQDRLGLHQKESRPVMDGLHAWLKAKLDNKEVEPNSRLGAAIRYMLKRWPRLTLFLRVAGAPLDANTVERALKRAIVHRKNSLFYKTENGAAVGDTFMSLIYTAEQNNVDPFHYLSALLDHADEVASTPGAWMPWTYIDSVDSLTPPT